MFRKTLQTKRQIPWNKGKLIGQKSPLTAQEIWSIRMTLENDGRLRDFLDLQESPGTQDRRTPPAPPPVERTRSAPSHSAVSDRGQVGAGAVRLGARVDVAERDEAIRVLAANLEHILGRRVLAPALGAHQRQQYSHVDAHRVHHGNELLRSGEVVAAHAVGHTSRSGRVQMEVDEHGLSPRRIGSLS